MPIFPRDKYIEQTLRFKDEGLIKVITGIRRCGKSTLLYLVSEKLHAEGIPRERIASLSLESFHEETPRDARSLYNYFQQRASSHRSSDRLYIFIDEVQIIEGWEEAVNAMRVDLNCDIYVSGSNAFLLSSELATYLSGRYVEIKMLPLTFREYLEFKIPEYKVGTSTGIHSIGWVVTDSQNRVVSIDQLFNEYRQYGGLPYLATKEFRADEHRNYMDSLYQSVITRDILNRERMRLRRKLTNPDLLRRLLLFLADNIGNNNSFNSINNTLKAEKLNVANATIEAYISALEDAYVFYAVPRYDIKGKDYLKTLGKYYMVDPGIRNFLLGYRNLDPGRVLENIIYLQLLYNGFEVATGVRGGVEIDFVASKPGNRIYLQVAESIDSPATLIRELEPFKRIKDAYPRYLIIGSGNLPTDIDGVRVIKATDFLLGLVDDSYLK